MKYKAYLNLNYQLSTPLLFINVQTHGHTCNLVKILGTFKLTESQAFLQNSFFYLLNQSKVLIRSTIENRFVLWRNRSHRFKLTQRRFWQMIMRHQSETIKSDLMDRIDGLKNSRHPLETLKRSKVKLSWHVMFSCNFWRESNNLILTKLLTVTDSYYQSY